MRHENALHPYPNRSEIKKFTFFFSSLELVPFIFLR